MPPLATPLHYQLALDVDPRSDRFAGDVIITVAVPAPTRVVVLNAERLDLISVTAEADLNKMVGTASPRAALGSGANDQLLLSFPRALPKGVAKLHLTYRAPYAESPWGLFHVKAAERWYAFTNFEPSYARRAFPGFDEPSFRVPVDLTVTVPAGMVAVSNMPAVERVRTPTGTRFRFGTTPPLATYLVSVAIGDFDVEATGGAVPIHLYRPKGTPGSAEKPLEIANGMLQAVSRYFEQAFPFPKLDLVAIPDFSPWTALSSQPRSGAMSNAGLITISDSELLQSDRGIFGRRRLVFLIGHEIVHQWVGNVTGIGWWDDISFEEGLSWFLHYRALDAWQPAYGARLELSSKIQGALQWITDLPIRRSVTTTEQAHRTVYANAASHSRYTGILVMLERWVGPEVFRAALREYVRQETGKSAGTDEFVRALERASGKPLKAAIDSFMTQRGSPELELTQTCVSGKLESVAISQHPFDSAAPTALPFCMKAPEQPVVCEQLSSQTTIVRMSSGLGPCPLWIDPNPELAGSYRYTVTSDQLALAGAVADRLGSDAKLGLLLAARARVRRHELQPAEVLRFLTSLDRETDHTLLEREERILEEISTTWVTAQSRAAFQSYVSRRTAQARLWLGMSQHGVATPSIPAVTGDDNRVRVELVVLRLGALTNDSALFDAADRIAQAWRANPGGVDGEIIQAAFALAARRANSERFERLVSDVEHPSRPQNRAFALEALGSVENPALLRQALDLTLTLDLTADEAASLIRAAVERPLASGLAYDWVVQHSSAIQRKWTGSSLRPFIDLVRSACDPARVDAFDKAFRPLSATAGLLDLLGQREDEARTCQDLRAYGESTVSEYLAHARR